jgi:uncharacterized protein (TIGR03790 family)
MVCRILGAVLSLGLAVNVKGEGLAERVVILANSNDPDSPAIARHYAAVRSVPLANIVTLAAPTSETITWKEFVSTIWRPLEDELVKRGWISAIPMDLYDDVGRRKFAVSGHRIAALVVCRGIPLRIENDPALFKEAAPYTDHPQFRTNQGAVDSELSLLAQTDYAINASIPNPLFLNEHPTDFALAQVVKVSRLDGPTAAQAAHLVDLAVEAERTPLAGRAYVDMAGPYDSANKWLSVAAYKIGSMGIDLSIGRGPATFTAGDRIDVPILYFGWYAQDLNGPFLLPGFRFPVGAVAEHIHSFSAHTLRSDTEGWCGPFVARGVTATVGNVYEPYLEYLHRPDLLMEALGRGENLVDAAYYAMPVLSWQSIVIGDPLYRPFGHDGTVAAPNAGYEAMRQMNLLDAAGKHAEAIAAGKEALKKSPGLALALALAGRIEASGNRDEGLWIVIGAAGNADTSLGNWALLRESAQYLYSRKRSAEALDLYRRIFDIEALPASLKAVWLPEARVVALESGDTAQAADWQQQMEQLGGKIPAR